METPLPKANWYAVCTKPNAETKVEASLRKMKFETYLPEKKTQKSWSFFKRVEAEALFPCIIFVKTFVERLAEIRQVNGVMNFLYWLNSPAVIHPRDIRLIKSFVEQHTQVKIGNMPVCYGKLSSTNNDDAAFAYLAKEGMEYVSLASLGYVLIGDVVCDEAAKVRSINNKDATPLYSYRDAS